MSIENELDGLWEIRPGMQTLIFRGATIEIRIDGEGVHYVVNGVERDRIQLSKHPNPLTLVDGFKRRVAGQLSNGIWPPT